MGISGSRNLPTEEVIDILVSSYKNSERNQEVQSELALLSKKVTTLNASTLVDAHIANT